MTKMKQWKCRNKHILGFVRWNGNGIPQLMVLREALDMQAEHPDEVDLLGPLDGRMPIRCSICDDVQVWVISVESLVALLMDANEKTIFEVSQRLVELNRMVLDVANDPAPIGFATSPISKPEMGEEEREVHDASI